MKKKHITNAHLLKIPATYCHQKIVYQFILWPRMRAFFKQKHKNIFAFPFENTKIPFCRKHTKIIAFTILMFMLCWNIFPWCYLWMDWYEYFYNILCRHFMGLHISMHKSKRCNNNFYFSGLKITDREIMFCVRYQLIISTLPAPRLDSHVRHIIYIQ